MSTRNPYSSTFQTLEENLEDGNLDAFDVAMAALEYLNAADLEELARQVDKRYNEQRN